MKELVSISLSFINYLLMINAAWDKFHRKDMGGETATDILVEKEDWHLVSF